MANEKRKANNRNGYNKDFRSLFVSEIVETMTTASTKREIVETWKKATKELKERKYKTASKSSFMSEIRKRCKEELTNSNTRINQRRIKYIFDVVHLTKAERTKLEKENRTQVRKRQNNNRKIVDSLSEIVKDLNRSIKNGESRFKYEVYTYIVGLCTGRRTDEIFKTGDFFKPISENEILFSGQSKKKGKEESYKIPCLFLDSETVCKYIKFIHQLKPIPNEKRVNTLVSPHLNKKIKKVFEGKIFQENSKGENIDVSNTVSMHSLRGMYAMYYIEHVAEKKAKATRLIIQELLGHEDDNIGHCYEDYYPLR